MTKLHSNTDKGEDHNWFINIRKHLYFVLRKKNHSTPKTQQRRWKALLLVFLWKFFFPFKSESRNYLVVGLDWRIDHGPDEKLKKIGGSRQSRSLHAPENKSINSGGREIFINPWEGLNMQIDLISSNYLTNNIWFEFCFGPPPLLTADKPVKSPNTKPFKTK